MSPLARPASTARGFYGFLPYLNWGMAVLLGLSALVHLSAPIDVIIDDEGYYWGAACFPWYYETRTLYIAHAVTVGLFNASLAVSFGIAAKTKNRQTVLWVWVALAAYALLSFFDVPEKLYRLSPGC